MKLKPRLIKLKKKLMKRRKQLKKPKIMLKRLKRLKNLAIWQQLTLKPTRLRPQLKLLNKLQEIGRAHV